MSNSADQIVSLAEAARLFEERGISVDRSTLSRFADKHDLKRFGTKQRPMVRMADLVARWQGDDGRAIKSGEASGLRENRRLWGTSTDDDTATPTVAAQQTDAFDQSAPANPAASVAVAEKSERLRKLRRENAEAEGALVPVSEVAGAVAMAINEIDAFLRLASRQTAEEMVAEFGIPSDQLIAVKARLNAMREGVMQQFQTRMTELARGPGEETEVARARLQDLERRDRELRSSVGGANHHA